MLTYGTVEVDGRLESYAETDEFSYRGDNYLVRVTALHPYKDYANGGDELLVNLEYTNQGNGKTGHFTRVWIEQRRANEHQRRHSTFRTLQRLMVASEEIGNE